MYLYFLYHFGTPYFMVGVWKAGLLTSFVIIVWSLIFSFSCMFNVIFINLPNPLGPDKTSIGFSEMSDPIN